ncbi:MAG TPA: nicotinamide riboside transporter PnuC [Bacteroidia bacterium]|nr:nicotinamide riboside transporter PnuC [Bacteroidia bacterium]HNT79802.1 nicotinamide riboside transporter PnuC [Bacteroidia bacterium]
MTVLEIIGFVFGIAGVWLTIIQNKLCFAVGLVNVSISAYLFFHQQLYNDVIQQFVYMALLTYGWFNWVKNEPEKKLDKSNVKQKESLQVSTESTLNLFGLFLLVVIYTLITGYVFKTYTDARIPYIDAAASAICFVAQYLIAKKKIENWFLWMFVNVVYIIIYLNMNLYLYALLFAVYFVLAIKGYFDWKKSMKQIAYE